MRGGSILAGALSQVINEAIGGFWGFWVGRLPVWYSWLGEPWVVVAPIGSLLAGVVLP
jgi:hypothetical protein